MEETRQNLRPGRRLLTTRNARWLAPAAAVGVVAVIATGALSANANPNLPQQSAAQLLAAVSDAKVAGFSGTIVEKASLGLPELSTTGTDSSTSLLGLLYGSHTVRVWYAGETKQRVALLASFGEQDIFRNGRDLWQWNSSTQQSSHTLLPSAAAKTSPTQVPAITPAEAAARALAFVNPTTAVSTDRTGIVAGRSAYTLVLQPKDARSTVGSVRIAVDGKTKVPLSVKVFARNATRPALDISFTRVDFSVPDNDFFTFSPPAGAHPMQETKGLTGTPGRITQAQATGYRTIGDGWTSVAEVTGAPSLSRLAGQGGELAPILRKLPAVSGSWGKGHLFSTALVNALLTDDGRLYVGAVEPDVLYEAAGSK